MEKTKANLIKAVTDFINDANIDDLDYEERAGILTRPHPVNHSEMINEYNGTKTLSIHVNGGAKDTYEIDEAEAWGERRPALRLAGRR